MDKIHEKNKFWFEIAFQITWNERKKFSLHHRTRYLSEIAESNRKYDVTAWAKNKLLKKLYGIYKTIETVSLNTRAEQSRNHDDSVLPTAVESWKAGAAENKILKLY
jgi:methylmalonyl-CoA mutase